MRARSWWSWRGAALVSFALAIACVHTSSESTNQPYAGTAYPSKRAPLPVFAGDYALVANYASDTITVIDLTANQVVTSVPVGISPVDIDGPHHIAIDRGNGVAYVTLAYPSSPAAPGSHAAHHVTKRAGFVQKLSLTDLSLLGESLLDPSPAEVAVSKDGRRVAITHYDLARAALANARTEDRWATVVAVTPEDLTIQGGIDLAHFATCAAPHGIVLSPPDGHYAYVACYGDDNMAIIDLATPSNPILRVPVGMNPAVPPAPPRYGPYTMAMAPDGTKIALANTESKDVRFFDVSAHAMAAQTVATYGSAFAPVYAADGQKLYVPSQTPDAVEAFDPATGMRKALRVFTMSECQRPAEAALGSDASTLYVVCEGDHVTPSVVLALDATTLATKHSFTAGVFPTRIAIGGKP